MHIQNFIKVKILFSWHLLDCLPPPAGPMTHMLDNKLTTNTLSHYGQSGLDMGGLAPSTFQFYNYSSIYISSVSFQSPFPKTLSVNVFAQVITAIILLLQSSSGYFMDIDTQSITMQSQSSHQHQHWNKYQNMKYPTSTANIPISVNFFFVL